MPGSSAFVTLCLGLGVFWLLYSGLGLRRQLGVAVAATERLLGWLAYRTYIVLPAVIAILWAVRACNPYILLGYLAFLPWALAHLAAQSEIAATLSGYMHIRL